MVRQGRGNTQVSILYKSVAGRYRPFRVADGPITARYIFTKNASQDHARPVQLVPFPLRTNKKFQFTCPGTMTSKL